VRILTGLTGGDLEGLLRTTPAMIAYFVGKDLEAVLRKIEYWHQAPVTKFRIMAWQGQGTWHGVRWDGQRSNDFCLE
jgi:hypothetical protein